MEVSSFFRWLSETQKGQVALPTTQRCTCVLSGTQIQAFWYLIQLFGTWLHHGNVNLFFFYSLLCIFTILYSILMRRISALIDPIATTRKTNQITFLGDSESVVICMFDRWYHSMSPHALKILRVSCSYVYFRTWQSLENLSLT